MTAHRKIETLAFPMAVLALIALATGGCDSKSPQGSSARGKQGAAGPTGLWREELFANAINNLNRLEEFDTSEVAKQISSRLRALDQTGQLPPELRGDTLMATWPEPETLRQTVNWLNQWVQTQEAPADWKPDSLLDKLPAPLGAMPAVQGLDKMEFSTLDGFALLEAVWLREVSAWARGKKLDKIEQAARLFDWTVRNIQLIADDPDRVPQFPWEILLFGRGTAMERAWVFILLCRQQGIDAALLALPETASSLSPAVERAQEKAAATTSPARLRLWCVGVLVEGKTCLFDPNLGLPIPAPDGVRAGPSGQLEIVPATLEQVRQDGNLLRRLDRDLRRPYWVRSDDVKRVVVLVEASPAYVSRRMWLVESHLAGEQRMALTSAAVAQAQRFKTATGAAEALPWSLPYQTLRRRRDGNLLMVKHRLALLVPFFPFAATMEFVRPTETDVPESQLPLFMRKSSPLYKGRLLYLKGNFTGRAGAVEALQEARPANAEMDADLSGAGASPQVREQLAGVYQLGKYSASYWLGLVAFEQGNHASAIDYFVKRTLDAKPNGYWTPGAHYNLGRTYEAMGRREKAAEEYLSDEVSPAVHGNLLRARWLKEL